MQAKNFCGTSLASRFALAEIDGLVVLETTLAEYRERA
jgi:hypothetical protein